MAGSGGTSSTVGCEATAALCAEDTYLCGVHKAGDCGEVDCGPCRFEKQVRPRADLTIDDDDVVHMAYGDYDDEVMYYLRSDAADGAKGEVIPDAPPSAKPSIAIAASGDVHVVWQGDNAGTPTVMHSVRAADTGTWSRTEIAAGSAPLVRVDASGTPHIFLRSSENRAGDTVQHWVPDGDTYATDWESTPIISGEIPVALTSHGPIALAYLMSTEKKIGLMEIGADGTPVESASPDLGAYANSVAADFSSDGLLHVVALTGNFTLITGEALHHLTREGDTWASEDLATIAGQRTWGFAIAAGDNGSMHLIYHANRPRGVYYTRIGSSEQVLLTEECEDGLAAIAVDSRDRPHLMHMCGALNYLTPMEAYPDDYADTCAEAASQLCDRACECGAPDCCYGGGGGDTGRSCTFGPGTSARDLCLSGATYKLCGDITQAPEAVYGCHTGLQADTAPMCVPQDEYTKYVIPDDCAYSPY